MERPAPRRGKPSESGPRTRGLRGTPRRLGSSRLDESIAITLRTTGLMGLRPRQGALPIPEHAANDPSTNAGASVEHLRAQLDRIMKAGA